MLRCRKCSAISIASTHAKLCCETGRGLNSAIRFASLVRDAIVRKNIFATRLRAVNPVTDQTAAVRHLTSPC